MENQVKVGVGVLIYNQKGQILLGLRKSKHGENSWSPPGGHLEYGESFAAAAHRETEEETGLHIDENHISICGVTNDFFKESGKHYVTIVVKAAGYDGEPTIKEPDKCSAWQWFDLDHLPQNLFLPMQNFLASGCQLL